ncbi:selenium-dependent molybdenum cofactor biosynthesis protein YqeB [Clostridium sediminicola]|uniref:selenium-dependent molybdenum cofactor biosynthesis protein YqeB n=1 Tax=Clostridium sediminicola TaxID=3114879 RepID=UPI0031F1DD17
MFSKYTVIIKSGGDLATAVAHKLFSVGFSVIITELDNPMMVRRTVSFANCVYEKEWKVEGVTAVLAHNTQDVKKILGQGKIPVVIDAKCSISQELKPTVIIDGILAKKNRGTKITDAPIVIGLGPGFTAGEDVDMVIETQRGHKLGKIICKGQAIANTGIPGNIMGYTSQRVLRSSCKGIVKNFVDIGSNVETGQTICSVDGEDVVAEIRGIVRGLIHDGLFVKNKEKLGDIDPRGEKEYCYIISEKGRNIAGGTLEAILVELNKRYCLKVENRE